MKALRYTIHHFDLAKADIGLPSESGAQYWLFWFNSVPLGDKYIDNAESINEEFFFKQCLAAIWPALKLYHGKRSQTPLKKVPATHHEIQKLCSQVLKPALPDHVPDYCDMTVVICTRNRPEFLRTCLHRLQQQVCKPREIIVVDNASSTQDTRTVVEEFSEVRYLWEGRAGLDVARNTGAAAAKYDLIAYTDDDTIPNAYWAYRVYETFRDPSIAAMTGLVIAASLETEAEVIFEKYWPFNRGYVTKLYDNNFFSTNLKTGPPVWQIGAGANMAFRKSVFEEVGYFDERLDVGAAGCSGDSEQWYRILANGFRILYNPLAVVQHSHRTSLEGLKKQLHGYMRGFTVAILIQYQKFGHVGNIKHLIKVFPFYYLTLLGKGFPFYNAQYKTVFSEMAGVISGLFYYWKHRDKRRKNILGWEQ